MTQLESSSEHKQLKIRNEIFLTKGVPALQEKGFKKSPFSSAWYGKDDSGDYIYELCKLTNDSILQMMTVEIVEEDKWIKLFLNIFNLQPDVKNILDLEGCNGLKYHLPPNSFSKMRLRVDDIKGIPLFNYQFMFGGHQLKSFNSETTMKRRIIELENIIEKDLTNLESFIKKWYEIYHVNIVDWEGNLVI